MEIVLHNLNRRSRDFVDKIEFATSTMKNIQLDPDVQREVLTYLSKIHNKLDQRKDLDSLMFNLSPSLKKLVTRKLFLNVFQEHPVFSGMSEVYDYILDNIEAKQFVPD